MRRSGISELVAAAAEGGVSEGGVSEVGVANLVHIMLLIQMVNFSVFFRRVNFVCRVK